MFLNLQVFAFEGQNMTFTVNVFFTCILSCDAGPGCDKKYHKYLPSFVFLRRRRSFTSRLEKFLCFLPLSDRAYVSGARCIGLFFL